MCHHAAKHHNDCSLGAPAPYETPELNLRRDTDRSKGCKQDRSIWGVWQKESLLRPLLWCELRFAVYVFTLPDPSAGRRLSSCFIRNGSRLQAGLHSREGWALLVALDHDQRAETVQAREWNYKCNKGAEWPKCEHDTGAKKESSAALRAASFYSEMAFKFFGFFLKICLSLTRSALHKQTISQPDLIGSVQEVLKHH